MSNNPKILMVVDDMSMVQHLYKRMIADICKICETQIASNGKEAVMLYAENPETTIIFMDVCMPIMDGFEATREIRKIEEKEGRSRVPIIAISCIDDVSVIKQMYEAGADKYMSKPVSRSQIEEVIRKYVKLP